MMGITICRSQSPKSRSIGTYPELGSRRRRSAKTSIPIMPSQNMGIDTPMLAKNEITLSSHFPRFFAAAMPSSMPVQVPMRKAGTTMDRVTPSRGNTISAISD